MNIRFLTIAISALCISLATAAPPRVLVLGESYYLSPTQQITKILSDKAVVIHSNLSQEVYNSTSALANLDALLGKEKWDVIHFNYGLGDLIHRAPDIKSFRSMSKRAGGVPATSPAEYEKNLTEIVKRLKATGAKLIWASTTPITGDSLGLYEAGSEIEYNAIAAKIMAANQIPINDMHTAVTTMMAETKQVSNTPGTFGRTSIHPPLLKAICQELSIPVPEELPK